MPTKSKSKLQKGDHVTSTINPVGGPYRVLTSGPKRTKVCEVDHPAYTYYSDTAIFRPAAEISIDDPTVQNWTGGIAVVAHRWDKARDVLMIVTRESGGHYQLVRAFRIGGETHVSIDVSLEGHDEFIAELLRMLVK